MDSKTVLTILFVITFGELTFGWSRSQKYKTYRRYQKNLKLYFLLLFIAAGLTIIPLTNIFNGQDLNGQEFWFSFFIYLVLFKLVDLISIQFNKRPIIIATRWDMGTNQRSWLDVFLALFAFLTTLFLTIPIGQKW
jgi:hypothetical protein